MLDTNVLISALLFQKRLGVFLHLINAGVITPCFLVTTFREFQCTLVYPKFAQTFQRLNLDPDDIQEIIAAQSLMLHDPEHIPEYVADAPDNFILACALAADVRSIITGDKALLHLKDFKGIPIISPRRFLETMGYV